MKIHATHPAAKTANAVRLLRALTTKVRRRKVPIKRWPMAVERDYGAALRTLTIAAVAPGLAGIMHELPTLVGSAKAALTIDELRAASRVDGGEVKTLVDVAYKSMVERLSVRDIAAIAYRFGNQIAGHNAKELGRQLEAAFGVPVSIPDTKTPRSIDAFVDQNVSLVLDNVERLVGSIEKDITRMLASTRLDARSPATSRSPAATRPAVRQSVPALQNVRLIVNRPTDFDAQALAASIQRNVAIGGSTRELAEELSDRFDFAADHAEFIARDQVGKLTGQLSAQRSQALGITQFVWRTSGDERVRDEHEARDGETYDYDNPPDGELPGEPINCRCSDEPVLDDIAGAADDEG